ncbi:TPA: hypothetical protein DDW35_11105 [Candidatus Sumerlaeota bacterium]|jgi:hypothetical protein|nr:hypothetical protein [Candidatus Sumerlaeota bacterium]
MNRDQLMEVLEQQKVKTVTFEYADGGAVVVTQRGARILGVFPSGEGRSSNAMWVNPHIEALFSGVATDWDGQGEGGMGGGRFWVSPEQNYYYNKDAKTFDGWFCQLPMDPGTYEVTDCSATSVTYRNQFDLHDYLTGSDLKNLSVERSISPLANPLLNTPVWSALKDKVGYVGVATTDDLQLPATSDKAPTLCPWTLVQVPTALGGGPSTVIVPTAKQAQPLGYFGEIPADRLRVFPNYVQYKIDAQLVTKLGILPEDIAPQGNIRIAYLRAVGNADDDSACATPCCKWQLVVLESDSVARDQKDVIDPAKVDPAGPKGAIQSYNSGSTGSAKFGEIEVQHLPVTLTNGVYQTVVNNRLYAFQGAKADVLAIAENLLGLKNIELFG